VRWRMPKDYKAFEAAIITDYDAQSAVEHELVLRLTRLRRVTSMATDLFEIQAEHLRGYRQTRQLPANSRDVIGALFRGQAICRSVRPSGRGDFCPSKSKNMTTALGRASFHCRVGINSPKPAP
jgi:hypothetical protein